ncbi:hypothetical protein KEM48_013112 [Puccinia striiformis f. sp. tritici PST-130]|uniref:Uncharacterized protein n=1 Tax=Puccinia striiformis f. sp. tritici PST-78 TaxID=1165861 RepID=A0A0L0VVC5_9BASI|nr:hypothetical protein H4Q26_014130 [Puccinia striiformis f. sp. tritici PST-130]KAI9629316.1 hypothetical protein KEM48_013112 [Puccinia striiformis f. sp. tritici PST-130]KNF03147.1 hypothetical protein PSTG_03734 [Puccinia striiformis f. sp. tritici PST-78]
MPKDYVGVKGPQFSFSRLASADPVLGVGMSLRSEKSVIFSIGVYTDKLEMLPLVQRLHRLRYTIYGTTGTNDFNLKNMAFHANSWKPFCRKKKPKGQNAK